MGLNYNDKKLLDKYNLSLSNLDYSYIKSATNVKEVENILKVLRSGEEGTYPDLIKFCENRLQEISPKSNLLQEPKNVSSYSELPHAEQASLHSDLKTWIEDIKNQEKDLKSNKKEMNSSYPIRNMGASKEKKEKKKKENSESSFESKSKRLSYEDWDRFDIDKEIKRLDQEQTIITETKQNNPVPTRKEPPLPFIDASGLTESEKQTLAEQEKVKGNECFKAKDYVNSAFYYSRSISVFPTAVAMCNRAFSHMKLSNFEAAVLDCDAALNLDPCYVKALYRRGLSYKEMGHMQLAYMDFESALKLDATCKEAKVQLKEISKCPISTSSTSVPVIEEISSSNERDNIIEKNYSGLHSLKCDSTKGHYSEKGNQNNGNSPSTETIDCLSSNSVNLPSNELNQEVSFNRKIVTEIKHENTNFNSNKSLTNVKSHFANKLKAESDKKMMSYIQESGEISGLNMKSNMDMKKSPCGNESGDKIEKPSAFKEEKSQPNCKELNDLQNEEMTPFKFLKFWHNLNAYKNSKVGAVILDKVTPDKLPSYVTNKLDADLLYSLILAIKEFTTSGNWFKSYQYLRNLINIPRIKTVSLLLSSSQRSEIETLLALIEENQRKDIIELKNVVLGKV